MANDAKLKKYLGLTAIVNVGHFCIENLTIKL